MSLSMILAHCEIAFRRGDVFGDLYEKIKYYQSLLSNALAQAEEHCSSSKFFVTARTSSESAEFCFQTLTLRCLAKWRLNHVAPVQAQIIRLWHEKNYKSEKLM